MKGRPLRIMGPGDGFGEIALLRDVPRTATVVALGALRTMTLYRTDFLAALSANVDSASAADALARGRLEAGSWPEPPQRPGPATGRNGPDPGRRPDGAVPAGSILPAGRAMLRSVPGLAAFRASSRGGQRHQVRRAVRRGRAGGRPARASREVTMPSTTPTRLGRCVGTVALALAAVVGPLAGEAAQRAW